MKYSKLATLLIVMGTFIYADVPHMINFQGYLTDSCGVPLDTTTSMTFEIYEDSTGGIALWSETHDSVVVDSGVFNVILGSQNSIPDTAFDSPNCWLEITIDSKKMEPRTRITSVGYAFTDHDWQRVGDEIYYLDGNVGIGTSNPGYDLEVADDFKVGDYLRVAGELYIFESGWVLSGYKLYVNGKSYFNGTVKFKFDYESDWTHVAPGNCITLTHNLGGDPEDYIVFLTGKSSQGGYIHQKNYGTNRPSAGSWYGCEWCRLTNTTITVWRGDHDDDMAPYDDWYWFKIRILKNQ